MVSFQVGQQSALVTRASQRQALFQLKPQDYLLDIFNSQWIKSSWELSWRRVAWEIKWLHGWSQGAILKKPSCHLVQGLKKYKGPWTKNTTTEQLKWKGWGQGLSLRQFRDIVPFAASYTGLHVSRTHVLLVVCFILLLFLTGETCFLPFVYWPGSDLLDRI